MLAPTGYEGCYKTPRTYLILGFHWGLYNLTIVIVPLTNNRKVPPIKDEWKTKPPDRRFWVDDLPGEPDLKEVYDIKY